MLKAFKKLWNNERGNALIIFGASLPLLVGAAGIATDTIQWTLWKRQLQRAADSGAIAGVYTRIKTDTQEAVAAAVNADLAINNHVGIALQTGYPNIDRPADDGNKKKQVKVTLQIAKSLPFSSMFMSAAPDIRATATAASVPGAGQYCIIGLDPSVAVTGVEISGSTYLDLGNCSLIANSTNPTTAASNGTSSASGGNGSTVKAASLAASGGVQYSKSWNVKDYDPNSPAADDPFSGVAKPKSADCTKNITLDGSKDVDRSSTDSAGEVVCITNVKGGKPDGLTIQKTMKLGPATYIINGGDLTMNNNNASLSCTGCTIAMTNFSDPTKTGNIKLTGGALNLTAPTTTGNYKGIALYQDPRATDSGQKSQNHVNGNSGQSITGAIYVPGRSILYNGGGSYSGQATEVGACMMLVGKRVEFGGNSKVKALDECTSSGLPPAQGGQRVRLVA